MESTSETTARDDAGGEAVRATQAPAGAAVLAQRVAELETLLGAERAEGARRLREMDGLMRQTRSALHELQGEFRRAISERDDLAEQVEERDLHVRELEQRVRTLLVRAENATSEREGATAEVVSALIARAQSAELALAQARRSVEALQERVRDLEQGAVGETGPAAERIAVLERELALRVQQLVRASETIQGLEGRLATAGRPPARAEGAPPESATETDSRPHPAARAAFADSSTYFPVADERPSAAPARAPEPESELGDGSSCDEDSTYLPVGDEEPAALSGAGDDSTYFPVADEGPSVPPAVEQQPGDGFEATATSSLTGTVLPVEEAPPPAVPATETKESATYLPVDAETDSLPVPALRDVPCAARVRVVDAPPPRERPPAALPVLDGLSVEREVARDAHGVLLHARDDTIGRAVAVLVLPRGTVRPSPASVARLTAVQHHNVLRVLRCELGPDGPYVVTERPTGERIDVWVRRVGGVSERIALAVAVQVARGLRDAAAAGVHHGDLSPRALWMDGSGVVRISGLGLWELLPHGEARSAEAFVAPERRRGDAPDARADMYSLGACLRFLVGAEAAVGDADARRARGRRASSRLRELADVLSADDPDARPADWDAAVELLEAALRAGEGATPARRESSSLVGTVSQRPHLAVGALAVVALAVAAWMHFQPAEETAVRKAFNEAVVRAAELEAQGNVEGARRIYLEFVEGTGDPDIELDAARRLDLLRR